MSNPKSRPMTKLFPVLTKSEYVLTKRKYPGKAWKSQTKSIKVYEILEFNKNYARFAVYKYAMPGELRSAVK